MDPYEKAKQELREALWADRDNVLDYLVLHDCDLRYAHELQCRVVGWDPSAFVMAALVDNRAMLDG
jgi:hypothetical protein